MKFVDLNAQFQALEPRMREAIDRVLTHGQFIMGPEVAELETALAEYAGVKHAIGCSSGADALLLALMAYGIGPGDAVLTTPFTFFATAEVISLLRATPVFVDCEADSFNINPAKLEQTIYRTRQENKLKLKGIIPVDLFGLPADYDAINEIAERNGLFVIEDAAQSFGASYKGRYAGSLGHIGTTSFFPAKPLGAYGDGGAMFTDDDKLAAVLKSLRIHGMGENQYDNVRIGITGRLDSMQAAVLLCKLEVFAEEVQTRNRLAQRYSELLGDTVLTPSVPTGYTSAWAQYSIVSKSRDHIRQTLNENGVPTAIYYPTPIHLSGAMAYLGYRKGDFPVSERLSQEILSLPIHPYLQEEQIERIAEIIVNAV